MGKLVQYKPESWNNCVEQFVKLLSSLTGKPNETKREIEHGYWADTVTEQPEGYVIDSEGNVEISTPEGLAWLSYIALPLVRHNKIVPTLLERIEGDEPIGALHHTGHIRPLDQKAHNTPAIGIKDCHVDATKSLERSTLSPLHMNLHAREAT